MVVQANLRLRRERNDSNAQRLRAVANLARTQDAVNRMLTQVATERMKGVPQMEPNIRGFGEGASLGRDPRFQAVWTHLEFQQLVRESSKKGAMTTR